MHLGPAHPTWKRLYEALASLASTCGGAFAFVVDEGNGLWCVGIPNRPPTTATADEDRAADRFYRDEIVPRTASIRRGIQIDVAKMNGDDRYAARSFAGIYAVVVWFEDDFEPDLVRARIRRSIPEIQALTLALPPSGGPGSDQGAGRLRA